MKPPQCSLGVLAQPIVYVHVMKTGGLSVDAMIKCRCRSAASPCALLREDGMLSGPGLNASGDLVAAFNRAALFGSPLCAGGPACAGAAKASVRRSASVLVEGEGAPCRAQVLATHAPPLSLLARPLWAAATTIAVFREPVARVWSFYLYLRRKMVRFQHTALPIILREHFGVGTAGAPSAAAARRNASEPAHAYRQLSNNMVMQFSATQEYRADTPLLPRRGRTAEAALKTALRTVDALTVVGLTEDMPGFAAALAARWPASFGRAGCAIPSGSTARNPTNARPIGPAPTTLDEPTRDAIRAINLLDVRLYARARERAAAMSAGG